MFLFDTCNAVPAREHRKPKYWRLGMPPYWIEFDVVTSHRQTRYLEYGLWLLIYMFLRRSQVIDPSSITQTEALWVWLCDVTTSKPIQDGVALVVNILVFDLRVQLQHCTYQRKTLLFASIKVSTFICKREISGLSSPLNEKLS